MLVVSNFWLADDVIVRGVLKKKPQSYDSGFIAPCSCVYPACSVISENMELSFYLTLYTLKGKSQLIKLWLIGSYHGIVCFLCN